MGVVLVNQLAWITFAPITGVAAKYYGVSDLSIGLLSMSFMLVYIIVSIPASWTIDTRGFRVGVGIGAALTGIFGMLRGLSGDNYTLVLIAQIGIAVGQPFILNALTKVAARWFPLGERATATGLGTLAMYFGIVLGMVLTPIMVLRLDIASMLTAYGVAALLAGILFLVLSRERPPTPANPPDQEERSLVFDGLRHMLRMKDFILLLLIFFIGLGVFNSVTTWIEDILRPRGFSILQAGVVGGLMVFGGILGAVIMPLLSDHYRRRVPFIISALIAATIGLLGITFAVNYALLLLSAFVMGFFLLSAGPIGFQYGAEITYPDPEGTSNGMLLLMGQISGILFILSMDSLKDPATGSMTASLVGLAGLMVIGLLLSTRLKESRLLGGERNLVK
jgi:MFS family permease